MSNDLLLTLRERVRRIERPAATVHGVLPFGVAAIDRTLPGGGLARGAVHELLGMGGDEEDGALAAAFAASILSRLGSPISPSQSPMQPGPSLSPFKGGEGNEARQFSLSAPGGREGRGEVGAIGAMRDGIVLWCLPRPDLYGPGLAVLGLDPARLVLVRAGRDAEILWAIEEGLRATGVAAVVGEVGAFPAVASRRLQLAAERSGVTAFVLRRWRDGARAARERNLPNASATRWRIAALPSQPVPMPSFAERFPQSPTRHSGMPQWGRPGTHKHGILPVFSQAGVHGFRARGQSPRPGMTMDMVGNGDPVTSGPRFRRIDSETEPGIGHPRWRVELLRCRGGVPACWEVEVADATGSLSLVATLADRPDAPFREDAVPPQKLRRTG
jgi:protein ImuA